MIIYTIHTLTGCTACSLNANLQITQLYIFFKATLKIYNYIASAVQSSKQPTLTQ